MSYQKLQAKKAKEITPNDNEDIFFSETVENTGCVLYVGAGGDLKVKTSNGDEVTFKGYSGGSFLPVQVVKVFSTGTTASDIIALW